MKLVKSEQRLSKVSSFSLILDNSIFKSNDNFLQRMVRYLLSISESD